MLSFLGSFLGGGGGGGAVFLSLVWGGGIDFVGCGFGGS